MSTNPLAPIYGPLYGSLYFCTLMSTAFYGITCMQAFFYYVHYQNDPLRIKSFVAAVWALNTIHEALTVSGTYKSIIAALENPFSIPTEIIEFIFQGLLTALVAVPTQGFFVHRIYVFSGKNIAAPLIWVVLAILQLVSAAMYVGKALYTANGVQVVTAIELTDTLFMNLATLCLSVAAGVDVLIAVVLTFLLLRKRTATTFASTAHTLQRLTLFAVNTGIWTATFALLTIILLHVFPLNMLYAVFGIPLCSVYCNTLLANLNARDYVRGEMTKPNVRPDLCTDPSSREFESVKTVKMVSSAPQTTIVARQGIWETTSDSSEVVTFPDVGSRQIQLSRTLEDV